MQHLTLHLVHCDFVNIDRSWNTRDVRSSFWRFYINNRDGASVWLKDGRRYALPAGQIHLIPAYVRFSCDNVALLEHLYAHFDVLGLTPFVQQRVFDAPISSALTAGARGMWKLYAAGVRPSNSAQCAAITQSILFEALGGHIAELPADRRRLIDQATAETDPVARAIKLIDERLPAPVSVGELAESCALSPDHFGRLFKDLIGQTPARYALERRVSLAARELLYGDGKIDAIALGHGFANRFHFTRAFARVMGTTPAEYRRTNRV